MTTEKLPVFLQALQSRGEPTTIEYALELKERFKKITRIARHYEINRECVRYYYDTYIKKQQEKENPTEPSKPYKNHKEYLQMLHSKQINVVNVLIRRWIDMPFKIDHQGNRVTR